MNADTPPTIAGLPPEFAAEAAEMRAYSEAHQAALLDGGSRETILAILHAAEPPGVQAGTFQRMSFGLDWLLEATGNGKEKWQEVMVAGSAGGHALTGSTIEALFIFSNPDAALESLGLDGANLMTFRKAAFAFARTVDDTAVEKAVAWMIREMLRYWGWLPFLEAAAAEAAPVPPTPKQDGGSPISTGSAPITESPSTAPSGASTRRPPWVCGLPLSKGGAGNIPAPGLRTAPASRPPAPSVLSAKRPLLQDTPRPHPPFKLEIVGVGEPMTPVVNVPPKTAPFTLPRPGPPVRS